MREGYYDYMLRRYKEETQREELSMQEGPFKSAFDSDTEGVIRREMSTYRWRNGTVYKDVVTRVYSADGDYHDTSTTMPLAKPNVESFNPRGPKQLNFSF